MDKNVKKNIESSMQRGFIPPRGSNSSGSGMSASQSSERTGFNKQGGSVTDNHSLRADTGRTMGSSTKDSKHGIHTDRSSSRRTESRRSGSMGSESRDKSNRKNV